MNGGTPSYSPHFLRGFLLLALVSVPLFEGCQTGAFRPSGEMAAACMLVEDGYGPDGSTEVRVETVAAGLEVPWGLAFLPNGDILVTERPGRLRLVRDGRLAREPLAVMDDSDTAEGGLLGIALHPDFATNGMFFLYRTVHPNDDDPLNRVERWQLTENGTAATRFGILLDNIPAATYHNGGRLRIGPDGMLYVGTGDARDPNLSQDPESLAGKLLRIDPDGSIPDDNPIPGSPVYLLGIRNTQGFDWPNDSTIWLTDHGPSGEMLRRDHDEVNVARAGDNLGWPTIYGCESSTGMVSPSITWADATPPGGAAVYTGDAIPEWQGSLLIGILGSRHLQRVALDASGSVTHHEVYFRNELGRLRDVVMGPDGHLYLTTSNCDGRGDCPADGDKVFRIVR